MKCYDRPPMPCFYECSLKRALAPGVAFPQLLMGAHPVGFASRPKPRFPIVHDRLQVHEGDKAGAGVEILVPGPVQPFLACTVDARNCNPRPYPFK